MYEALVLIDPDSPISLRDLERTLGGKDFSVPSRIDMEGDLLTLSLGEYQFRVWWASGPDVLAESQELADLYAQSHPAQERIARCGVRFEVVGDDDFDMDFFNDYVFIQEALEELGTVYIFDQADQSFAEA